MTDTAAYEVSEPPSSRTALLERAVERWKRQLVDLGGRNTLLYYRALRQGTLELTDADPVAVGHLLDGRAVTLSRLVPKRDELPAAAKRARTILAKAKENFEERGLSTLFLTWGMATWTNTRGTATPAAPLLLAELELSPRGGAAEDFDISIAGEWDVNPTLLRLLEADHGVLLDGDQLDEIAASEGRTAVQSALDSAASGIPGWATSDRVIVGNFSYAKLPLVRDLDLAIEDGVLEAHDLLCAITGDTDARSALRDRHPKVDINEPDFMAPEDEFLVLDADASQSYVINAVVKGADLVVEGPPGTGKSQTIANLIASLAARGKRVLFVAEKRAAIDAVLERLRNQGLGEIVLDLHGGASSRRALAQELAKALDAASATPKPSVRDIHDRVIRRRDELRRHSEAVHDKRPPWDVSLYDAQAVVLGTPSDRRADARFVGAVLMGLGAEAFRHARVDLDRFAALGGLALLAGRGPWASAFQAGTVATPDQAQQALAAASHAASTSLPNSVAWIDYVVGYCGLRPPASMAEWAETLALLDGVHTTLQRFNPAIFGSELGVPLPDLAAGLEPGSRTGVGGLTSRIFSGDVRKARTQLAPLWLNGKPKVHELHEAVVAAASQQQAWVSRSLDGGQPRLPDQLTGAAGAYEQFSIELRAIGAWAATGGLEARPAHDLGAHLESLVADSATLHKLPELHAIRQRLAAVGVLPLLTEIAERQLDPDQAVAAFDFAWHMSIISHLSVADPAVAGFDGVAHARALEDFRDADRSHIESGAARVRRAVAERAIASLDANPDGAAVVSREARKKQRHMPVRELFHQAPDVLTALKPCWAMSPLVVAQLLPVERCFDVVVFDEASQVTPADAVGALLRADRAVVAGDTRQLPPTTFFASQTHQDDDETEPIEGAELSLVEDMESVLDVMGSLLPPPSGTRTLGWHYRSRDERLIAFSNAQPKLYNRSLTTFPGVTGGLCPEHVLVSDRTGSDDSDSSAAEVRTVVELILEHATSRPHHSLGVITMGIKHAERITEALRLARSAHPELDQYFDHGPEGLANPEPVFVKNLERVQGDERDAIILSIGYGKSPQGRMLYRFGPLNQEGGERRLNVAITRARHRMTVVSSFSSSDMDPNRLRAEGAQMLGRYLAYAESGGEDLGRVGLSKAPLNPFERDVEAHLTQAGISLCPQFGASGYWIDFAAQHPARPGEMVLAIECDGVTYHSSPTARDRDRLRQDHLERLGWRFHRIWSTDWFRHREREVERAKATYDAAVAQADLERSAQGGSGSTAPTAPTRPAQELETGAPKRGPRPPILSGMSITDYRQGELVQLALWIESDTLLRTEDQLLTELMNELGFRKRGSRIVAALTAAIASARGQSPRSRS